MMRNALLLTIALCGALAACASDPKDSPEAMKATFADGLKAYDSGNFALAFKTWSSIEDVDLGAMRNVAVMLRTGKGVEKDPKAAEAIMQRAAEAGLFTAQADLGDMLLKGEADAPNPKAASQWLALAALAGHPMAEFELGQLYEQGSGVERNLETARSLYKAAAAKGVTEASQRLTALPPEAPQIPAQAPAQKP